jgi:hypothetical protein
MVPETMQNLRDITPLSSTAGILRDYTLRFNVGGIPWVEPSAAAVERCAAARVHGVLYELTEDDFARVGRTEGVPFAYRWQICEVYPYVGDSTNAGETALQTGTSVSAYTLVAGYPTKVDIPQASLIGTCLLKEPNCGNWTLTTYCSLKIRLLRRTCCYLKASPK